MQRAIIASTKNMNSRDTGRENRQEQQSGAVSHTASGHHVGNDEVMRLEQRLIIGRGRDGLIFRIGSANMVKTGPAGLGVGGFWGGWVLKVPRFQLNDLPQYYLRAVSSHINTTNPEYHARNSMIANFNFEAALQNSIWSHLCQTYLTSVGFPVMDERETWQPGYSTCAKLVHVKIELDEERRKVSVEQTIQRTQCHMMPEGVMDAFQALMNHFTVDLLLHFLRDILHQLAYLEAKGVVHGDFKLSNVLLLVWDDRTYIFVLADFWDAYTVDPEDGSCMELRTNVEMDANAKRYNLMARPGHDFRRLLRWKFTTEKFGTRLYKDPFVLAELRKAKKNRQRLRTIKGLNAGAINLWSFGVVMGSVLTANKDNEHLKSKVKDDILFSGRNDPNSKTLTESEAVAEFRKLYTETLKPSQSTSQSSTYRNRAVSPNSLIGNNVLIDNLKQVIMDYCMVLHNERGTTQDVIDALGLDAMSPEPSKRSIINDLHSCGRCTMCIWITKHAQRQMLHANHMSKAPVN